MSEPVFRAFLAGAEADLLDAATRRVLSIQDEAIDTLHALLSDANPFVRLRAAYGLLAHVLKLRELRNVEQRLTALELAYANEQSQAPR